MLTKKKTRRIQDSPVNIYCREILPFDASVSMSVRVGYTPFSAERENVQSQHARIHSDAGGLAVAYGGLHDVQADLAQVCY